MLKQIKMFEQLDFKKLDKLVNEIKEENELISKQTEKIVQIKNKIISINRSLISELLALKAWRTT